MPTAWSTIPLNDYENHMTAKHVAQLHVLSDIFGDVLRKWEPKSVAILGVAGGNGLERIDSSITHRIYGIDVNAVYLETVRERFASLPGLELHSINLAEQIIDLAPVDLVHAALIFEHAGVGRALTNALQLVAAHGLLSVVLQLPSRTQEEDISTVSSPAIQTLRDQFRLIEPTDFCENLHAGGFELIGERQHPLPSGKSFWIGLFRRT